MSSALKLFALASVLFTAEMAIAQGSHIRPEEKSPSAAQPTNQDKFDGFGTSDILPEFPGGQLAWEKYIRKNLRYPAKALKNRIQGKVLMRFQITKTGELKEIRVVRGLGYGTDEEAIRLIKKSPRWTPATYRGEPYLVAYTMPISFRLD